MIKIELVGAEEIQKRLGIFSSQTNNVIKKAVNETARYASREIRNDVRQNYTVKAGEVSGHIKVDSAKTSTLAAYVRVKGYNLSPRKYKVTTPRSGAKLQVMKQGSLKSLTRNGIKAFPMTINNAARTGNESAKDYAGIFQRKTKRRYPLRTIRSPAVSKLSEVRFRDGGLQDDVYEKLQREIDEQIYRALP